MSKELKGFRNDGRSIINTCVSSVVVVVVVVVVVGSSLQYMIYNEHKVLKT